jgi:hypothetical protein
MLNRGESECHILALLLWFPLPPGNPAQIAVVALKDVIQELLGTAAATAGPLAQVFPAGRRDCSFQLLPTGVKNPLEARKFCGVHWCAFGRSCPVRRAEIGRRVAGQALCYPEYICIGWRLEAKLL